MAFRTFLALDGVKGGEKMQSFVFLLYISSNIAQISSQVTVYNKTHNRVHKYIAIK
jgi:hypothetical protein